MQKMKVIDFESIEPFFSQERDGEKPFTTRKIDSKDKRFRALSQWQPHYQWGIKITNPATGESFLREIITVSYLRYFDLRQDDFWSQQAVFNDWKIIVMGKLAGGIR